VLTFWPCCTLLWKCQPFFLLECALFHDIWSTCFQRNLIFFRIFLLVQAVDKKRKGDSCCYPQRFSVSLLECFWKWLSFSCEEWNLYTVSIHLKAYWPVSFMNTLVLRYNKQKCFFFFVVSGDYWMTSLNRNTT